MTDNVKHLISNLIDNDIIKAKAYAKVILKENKTKKDEQFCAYQLRKLESSKQLIKLPPNISTFTKMEDVSLSFNPERYYLTDREQKLYETIIRNDKAAEVLSSLGINYVNSTLLYGESGTGKTTFGRFLAYKLNIPFLYIQFSFLMDSLLGKTNKNIFNIFNYAKQQRCVFMIDEIDAIGLSRGQTNDVGEMSRIVITLMQELDELSNKTILLGATNRIQDIDSALRRRFTREHKVLPLTEEESCKLIIKFMHDCGYGVISPDFIKKTSRIKKQSDIVKQIIKYIVEDREIEIKQVE